MTPWSASVGPRLGLTMLVVVTVAAAAAPWLAPTSPSTLFPSHTLAPPMWPRVIAPDGTWHGLHVRRLVQRDRLEHRYALGDPLPLQWLTDGRLVTSGDPDHPLLWLGSDVLGRDVWSRLLHGARYSLGLAVLAVAGACVLGTVVGLVAGWHGGALDAVLTRVADLFVVLPAIYVVLVFRAALPLSMPPAALFALMAVVLTLAGWPTVARGIRAVVLSERHREYVQAAVAAGAGRWRVMRHHLLPATLPLLATQAVLLLPTFVVAEATLSFVGLGFAEPTPSWGTLLGDTFSPLALRDAPWLFAPAAAITMVSIGAHLVSERIR
jgi:peptide/nickel transport system permease protein